jgi:hypothetical protein
VVQILTTNEQWNEDFYFRFPNRNLAEISAINGVAAPRQRAISVISLVKCGSLPTRRHDNLTFAEVSNRVETDYD